MGLKGSGLQAPDGATEASLWLTVMDEAVSTHHRGGRLSLTHSVPWKEGKVGNLQEAGNGEKDFFNLGHYNSTLCFTHAL